ncbi:glycosyltransferase family 4 protein [Thermicanus aegyptius]|uniref:glycosyltransferase family 4 protein n=1 Tax=Thermicanus aegyptius TaxID=94009 RepID=UPI0003FDFC89|nr:glycosyltransferase family 4 protein [Thermicanus aegyptius]
MLNHLKKKQNVKVFLSSFFFHLDDWREKYKQDMMNDPLPYGYQWAEDDNLSITYIEADSFEKRWFSRIPILKKIYPFLSLPFKVNRNDIIWTHYDKDALAIALYKKIPILKHRMPKQISCFVWLLDNYREYKPLKKKIISWLLKSIDKIIFHAKTEKNLFKNYFGIDSKHLQYVPFGINISSYSEGDIIPLDVPTPFVLSVGTDKHRDLDMLVEIANHFEGKINFIFATANISFAHEMREHKNITVVKANLKEIRWLYENSILVIVPLKYNEHVSGCTTVLETAARRKPIIITKVPGMDDYVLDRETGFMVEVGDKKGFITAIEDLLNNPGKRKYMGETAFQYIQEKQFTTKRWANDHKKITYELIGFSDQTFGGD